MQELYQLDTLALSPLNHRQDVPHDEVIAMATSIASTGLLQNLMGLRKEGDAIDIVAGGKRMRALKWLAENNWTLPDGTTCHPIDPVPVKVTDDATVAAEWAGTENNARSPLHPADEVLSYRELASRGYGATAIARNFAVTETHVKRRLKLANLPDEVLTALRGNEITLDAATALTYAPDHDECLAALGLALGGQHAMHIKRDFTNGFIKSTDRRAKYVGLDAYIAAGGTIDEDLFEDTVWLTRPALLKSAFLDKLKDHAERIRADEGWAWAEAIEDAWINGQNTGMTYTRPERRELTEAEQEEWDDLERKLEHADELSAEDEARMHALEYSKDVWSDADRESSGIFVLVSHYGIVHTERAWQKPAAAVPDAGDDPQDATADDAVERVDAKPPFPQNLLDDLAAIRLHAFQVPLAGKPELALDLLAFSIDPARKPWHRPLAISTTQARNTPEKDEGFTPDRRVAPEGVSHDNTDPVEAFEAFRVKGAKHRNKLLTEWLASSLAMSTDREALAQLLATTLDPAPRKHWTPTEGFFKRIQDPAYLNRLYIELTGIDATGDDANAFRDRKKAAKAKALSDLFNDLSVRETLGLSRAQNAAIDAWLPEPLMVGGAN